MFRFISVFLICLFCNSASVFAEKIDLSCTKYKITYHCSYTGKRCERFDEMVSDGEKSAISLDTDRNQLNYNRLQNLPYFEEGTEIKFYLVSGPYDVHLTLNRVSGDFTTEYRKLVKNHKQMFQFPNIDEKGFGTEITVWYNCKRQKALF